MTGKFVRNSCFAAAALAAGMIATPSVAAPGAALPALPSSFEQVTFEPYRLGMGFSDWSTLWHMV